MLASGNGTAQQCAQNLMSMARGECPYERCKGVDADLTDSPYSTAAGLMAEDIAWLFDNYEPRISRKAVSLILADMIEGTGQIRADIDVEAE